MKQYYFGDGIGSLPGFNESLRILLEEEQYSLGDVGMMFGVTRERIRQLSKLRLGIENHPSGRGLNAIRVWDDTLNRFHPIGLGEYAAQRRAEESAKRKAARQERVRQRRQRLIETVFQLRAELNREPSWREVWERFSGRVGDTQCEARVIGVWGTKRGVGMSTKIRETILAGAAWDPPERRGAYRPEINSCYRGHAFTPENTYVYKGYRHCRTCQRMRDAKRYDKKRKPRQLSG